MTNPTSNFGWQMPTSTDLVTDLPADFETFGQAVDTSLADLKGGTTGQVLAKASNTNMDFTWVAQDDSNAIQNAIVDAKGDLIAASANDTPARLAVGNNGETLVADSSTTTGLRYQAPAAQQPVLNSAFQIWQRGTSFANSGSAVYGADRWASYRGGFASGSTVSRQLTGDTTNLPNIQYCARVQRDSGNTSTQTIFITQIFESVNSIPFAGKTVTLSFYARRGANYSGTSNLMITQLSTGTGTDQTIWGGFTGQTNAIDSTATLTTTWQRFTFTGTLASNITQLSMQIAVNPTGTAGAADFFEVTGVQLETGSVATQFKTYAATLQGELSACQRYYQRKASTANYQPYSMGFNYNTTQSTWVMALPVTMRTSPTMGFSAASTFVIQHTTNLTQATTIAGDRYAPDVVQFYSVVASGLTAGQSVSLNNQTGATGFIEMIAEL
jgi:hypothetical protein